MTAHRSEPVMTIQGDTLERVAWRVYGDGYRHLLAEVADLNPDLVALGPVLPAGRLVQLPAVPDEPTPRSRPVRLWD